MISLPGRFTTRGAFVARMLAACSAIFIFTVMGLCQQATPTPETDVVRIDAALAQTSVTVVDKKGRPVEGLRKEDFSLTVDGKSVPIEFFEGVVTGSVRDRALQNRDPGTPSADVAKAASFAPARTIIFYIDDHHLSLSSLDRTRTAILNFIDKQMGTDDQVAIASPSGRVGFLQQFTDNKDVLRAAVRRLGVVGLTTTDYGANPGAPMTEYNALSVEKRDDPGLFSFYVQNCVLSAPRGFDARQARAMKERCEVEVRNRARQVIIQAGVITDGTYSSFDKLLESAARMPGRKLAFFFSDGFLADTGPRGRVSHSSIGEMTAKARAASVVVYTVDARGLVSASHDASGSSAFDPDGRLESAQLRAIAASQDALHAIAADTGGRALRNQSEFGEFINSAIDETSRFYLIAWRPDEGADRKEKLRNVQITIPTRTDLTILAGHKFTAATTTTTTTPKVDPKKPTGPDADLKAALADYLGGGGLPVFMSLNYVDAPANGPLLTTSVEIPAASLSFGSEGKDSGQVTIAGVVLDDHGKAAVGFGRGLKVAPRTAAGADASKIIYNHPTVIKPGLYQVRLAVRDDRSGLVGSSNSWISIPNLGSGDLELSSIFFDARDSNQPSPAKGNGAVEWSVDKSFQAGSSLNILAFVYNAGATSDVEARTAIYRSTQELVSSPFEKVVLEAGGDRQRIGLTRRLKLEGLAPGKYTFSLIVRDRTKRKEVTRNVSFSIK